MTSTESSETTVDAQDLSAQLAALHRSAAVIEFELDGTIRTANDNFLAAVGYRLDEIQGRHHRLFVSEEHAASEEYADLWKRLAAGEFLSGEFQRFTKDGREIWIQASYNPIQDESGRPYKIVKFASDITAAKLAAHDSTSQIEALHLSQAVIEFELDGTIRTANENFLAAVGYDLEEIRGRHHRIFMFTEDAASPEYAAHWERLAAGEFFAGEYRRRRKDGSELWIHASYNPIRRPDGRLWKVVKFASDITAMVQVRKEAADTARALSSAAHELSEVSRQMSQYSSTATHQTGGVVDAARRTSERMQSLASATDEMTASISEISSNAQLASEVAGEAVEAARRTTQTVRRLGSSSEEIETVIKVITSIAQQTNLLALNASIEAARAGAAGAGFAVVAGEVKQLARQTAEATREIGDKIRAIQTETAESVDAIEAITRTVARINDLQTSIASAVEEQTATTQEMRGQVGDATTEIVSIDESVQAVARTTQEAEQGAQTTAASAEELNSIAERLDRLVDRL